MIKRNGRGLYREYKFYYITSSDDLCIKYKNIDKNNIKDVILDEHPYTIIPVGKITEKAIRNNNQRIRRLNTYI